jgi:hypothetical protein
MPRRITFSILDWFVFTAVLAVLILMNVQTHDGISNQLESCGFPFRYYETILVIENMSYGYPFHVKTTTDWKWLLLNVIICAALAAACATAVRFLLTWTSRLKRRKRTCDAGEIDDLASGGFTDISTRNAQQSDRDEARRT